MITDYHFTTATSKNAEQVIADLEEVLKEEKFGILWKFEVHKKLEEKGLSANHKITILEVCNPNEAHGILEIDPMASYFLPCKMIVTEESNQTKIGLVRPSLLIGLMNDEKLTKVGKEIENRLISSIQKAV